LSPAGFWPVQFVSDPIVFLSLILSIVCGWMLWRSSASRPHDTQNVAGPFVRPFLVILFCAGVLSLVYAIYWNLTENLALLLFFCLPALFLFATLLFFRFNRRSKAVPGLLRLIVGNLFILLVLLTSTLPVCEIYYRFLRDTTDSFTNTKVSKRWLKRHFHLNAAGFRDGMEYSNSIAKGKRRVTFMGDSFTAGHGIADVQDRFANIIRRQHSDWEIHVLAQLGMDTGPEIEDLKKRFAGGYQADLVVLVYCLNDAVDLLPEWTENLNRVSTQMVSRPRIFDNSYALDFFYHRLVMTRVPWMGDYFNNVKQCYQGQLWEQQQQRLKTLRDLVDGNGGQFMVITFPFLHRLDGQYDYQVAHDALNGWWSELNVPHLDLLPLFMGMSPKKITVNRFDAHPNQLAHALAANQIETFLMKQMTGSTLR
jgi:hypothetical protein